MAEITTIMRGSLGLNTVDDPARLLTDERGFCELAEAVNVDIEPSGRVTRRRGFGVTARTEASHSLWCDGGDCLFVSGDTLYRLNPDYSKEALTGGLTESARMSYVQVGSDVFYVNGFQKGSIPNSQAVSVWESGGYVGPSTTSIYSDPPVGHLVSYHVARVLIAQDNILWYSHPFAFSSFDLSQGFVSEFDRITMIAPVNGGVFVGTEKFILFYAGFDLKSSQRRLIANYGVIEGSAAKAQTGGGLSWIWTTPEGICSGTDDGAFSNLTQNKITYPDSRHSAGFVWDKQYITLLQE